MPHLLLKKPATAGFFILMTRVFDLPYFTHLIDGIGIFSNQLSLSYFVGEGYTTPG